MLHLIMKQKRFSSFDTPEIKQVFAILRQAGGEARLVGGCVRDVLLNKIPKDYDFAVNLLPTTVTDIFK